MTERKTYRDEMNAGMGRIALVIDHVWGGRCTMYEASCHTCHVWAVFDYMMAVCDSTELDDAVPGGADDG